MKEIPLTQGKVALVDDADYERVLQFKWCAMKARNGFYAVAHIPKGNNRLMLMHRFILDAPPGVQVDHRDRNGLHNTRENMRLATPRQNRANSPKPASQSSPYMGVRWVPSKKMWQAKIRTDMQYEDLGLFDSPEAAAKAYDDAAIEKNGAFAQLNFPAREIA